MPWRLFWTLESLVLKFNCCVLAGFPPPAVLQDLEARGELVGHTPERYGGAEDAVARRNRVTQHELPTNYSGRQ